MRMAGPRTTSLLFVGVMVVLSGCVSQTFTTDSHGGAIGKVGRPLVVAVLDSGTNPYHKVFERASVPLMPDAHAELLSLTKSSSFEDAFATDQALWGELKHQTLYRFSGTNLLGISFARDTSPPLLDPTGHGTATSAVFSQTSPQAVVVLVQVTPLLCTDPTTCLVDPSVAEGMEWIANQSWIDIVSISMGIPTHTPDVELVHPEKVKFLNASRKAASDGKLIVAAAGNLPLVPWLDYFSGPPWVIAVGGAEVMARGESPYAAKGVDVVANYSQISAVAGTKDQMAWFAGTSFATPLVAGTLAEALQCANKHRPEEGGPFPVSAVRDSLNHSAIRFGSTEWNPTAGPRGEILEDAKYPGLPRLVPGAQMGWGYINGTLSGVICERLVSGLTQTPPEKLAEAMHQRMLQKFREEYWSRVDSQPGVLVSIDERASPSGSAYTRPIAEANGTS